MHWVCETGGPEALSSIGWSQTSLMTEDVVTVYMYPAKTGTPVGRLEQSGCLVPVGSEEARSGADLRPPLKLYVPISGIQLSRRRPQTRARSKRRNERKQVDQAQLFVQRRRWQLLPARGPPPPKTMRPNAPHDPAVESVEECSDMGALVIVAPPSQCWIQFRDQFLGFPRVTALR